MDSVQAEFPALAGMREVAEILGVSRQRAYELIKKPTFPKPVVKLMTGPLWLASAVEKFAESRRKVPGRVPWHQDML